VAAVFAGDRTLGEEVAADMAFFALLGLVSWARALPRLIATTLPARAAGTLGALGGADTILPCTR